MVLQEEESAEASLMNIPSLWVPVPIASLGLWFLNPGCLLHNSVFHLY